MRLVVSMRFAGLALALLCAGGAFCRAQSLPAFSGAFSPVLEVEVAATPQQVWKALTDDEDLSRWFCRSADLDCRVGGRFRWSDELIDVRAEAEELRRIQERVRREQLSAVQALRLLPPDRWQHAQVVTVRPLRTIEYDWRWEGVPTRVSWDVIPVPPKPRERESRTLVRVSHLILRNQARREYVFAGPLMNLREYLADGEIECRYPDEVHLSGDERAELKTKIEAPVSRVWSFLTQPVEMNRYQSGGQSFTDLRIGGTLTYGWGESGTIRDLKPQKLLAHTWDTGDQQVVWELDDKGKRETELRLTLIEPKGNPRRRERVVRWADLLRRLRYVAETNDSMALLAR
jgi:uncharacterized protein YndB with AHSA1/START domain